MEHYVTLFDSKFVPQGLALRESMSRHAANRFTLWVVCMDELAKTLLDGLSMPDVRTIAVADVEAKFPELLTVKAQRSRVEYCWTMTPFTPQAIFDFDSSVERVTYVDADMFLLQDPAPMFAELERSGKSVLMTEHGYDPEYDQSATSGRYCVQFMCFIRGGCEPVLQWWQEKCIEWCFARLEAGRFGDQKYLDHWTSLFPDAVHVLSRPDWTLAPWNARRFPYSGAIVWHFHGLRILGGRRVLLYSNYEVPAVVDAHVYVPYVASLTRQLHLLQGDFVQASAPNGVVSFARSCVKHVLAMFGKLTRRIRVTRLHG